MLHSHSCLTALRRAALVCFGLAASVATASVAQAQTPPDIMTFVQQLDQAASQEDLLQVLEAYSETLSHGDGLTRDDLEAALIQFWEQYDNLVYETNVDSWERTGTGYSTETTTTITGTREMGDQALLLTAELTAQQDIVNGQIISQNILSESSSVTAGNNPPELKVNLPEQVDTGESFYFDAIVVEPLGERLLLGTAVEEIVSSAGYVALPEIEFELLTSGGLFKVGQAPATPGQRWLSAVVVRDDGIVGTTRRLQVTTAE